MFFMFYILLQLCKFLKTLHATPRVTYIEKEIKLNFCTPKQVHAHYNRSLNFILSLNVITSVRVDAIVIKQRRLFSNPQMIPKSMNCHILCLPRVPYFTNAMSLSRINIILILIQGDVIQSQTFSAVWAYVKCLISFFLSQGHHHTRSLS